MATAQKAAKKTENLFAVIRAGGQQFVVREGDLVTTEKLEGDFKEGDTMKFDDVLLVQSGDKTNIGAPTTGTVVTAEFVKAGRHPKVTVIKYKAKSNYFKKNGHRQPFMTWKIASIAA
jgi:large subunit ribosomal protein L21